MMEMEMIQETTEKKKQEIDTRIATILEPQPTFPECAGPLHDSISPLGAWVHTHIFDRGDECEVLPRPFSAELSLAWRVVEHFQHNGYMVSVNASANGGYWCCLYPPEGKFTETRIKASAAMAICSAALSTAQE